MRRLIPAPVRALFALLWDTVQRFLEDDALTLAGHIAYTALFALFPFLIFLSTLAGVIGQGAAAQRFIGIGLESLPDEVATTLAPAISEITERPRAGLMTVSILVALWAASSGIEALRSALNAAYNAEAPPVFWRSRLQSLVLTALFAGGILLTMIAIVAGPFLWSLLEWIAIVPAFYGWLYGASRWLVGVVVLFGVIAVLYLLLPNRQLGFADVAPGAAVAVALWAGGASLFQLYLAQLGRYTVTYGSLGGIVVTLLFFYLTACIFIFGAELNAALQRRFAARRAAAIAGRAARLAGAGGSG
jgi:membrane protein